MVWQYELMSSVRCTDHKETLWRWKKFLLSPGINMCKNCLSGKSFQEKIRFFILNESNEKIVMDVLKLQDIFLKTI